MIATFSSLFLAALQAAPQSAPPPPPAEPDISLTVSAHADSVRWRQVGSVRVRAWSEPEGVVVEENLSTGLPRPIPGQRTFRNVGWTLRGEATLAAETPTVSVETGQEETPTQERDPE